jgi:hypothetical protein
MGTRLPRTFQKFLLKKNDDSNEEVKISHNLIGVDCWIRKLVGWLVR